MVSAEPSATMDVLKEGIKAVAVGVGGSKPIPEHLVAPLIQVRTQAHTLAHHRAQSSCYNGRIRSRHVLSLKTREI